MFRQIVTVLACIALARAGHEAPPAKAVTYSVPSVAKVTYPGPTVTRHVETYSAPSIEKTVLITRTITAPLNAPAVKSVTYSAPAAPVHAAYGAPVQSAYGAPVLAAAPVQSYGAPVLAAAPVPQLAYAGVPSFSGYHGAHGINGQTVYSAPALGYSLGHQAQVAYAAPQYASPVAAVPSGEYGAPVSSY